MSDILIRNVPQHVVEALKTRAARRGRSVQAEALELLEGATQPAGAAFVDWLRAHRDPDIDARAGIDAIRQGRDER